MKIQNYETLEFHFFLLFKPYLNLLWLSTALVSGISLHFSKNWKPLSNDMSALSSSVTLRCRYSAFTQRCPGQCSSITLRCQYSAFTQRCPGQCSSIVLRCQCSAFTQRFHSQCSSFFLRCQCSAFTQRCPGQCLAFCLIFTLPRYV